MMKLKQVLYKAQHLPAVPIVFITVWRVHTDRATLGWRLVLPVVGP